VLGITTRTFFDYRQFAFPIITTGTSLGSFLELALYQYAGLYLCYSCFSSLLI